MRKAVKKSSELQGEIDWDREYAKRCKDERRREAEDSTRRWKEKKRVPLIRTSPKDKRLLRLIDSEDGKKRSTIIIWYLRRFPVEIQGATEEQREELYRLGRILAISEHEREQLINW